MTSKNTICLRNNVKLKLKVNGPKCKQVSEIC